MFSAQIDMLSAIYRLLAGLSSDTAGSVKEALLLCPHGESGHLCPSTRETASYGVEHEAVLWSCSCISQVLEIQPSCQNA